MIKTVPEINEIIKKSKEYNMAIDLVSDGYHTFEELYYHRMYLFSIICNQNKEFARKSKLHYDGTMYEDYFIVWIITPSGNYSYHYHINFWDMFDVLEVEVAPKWDGHTASDIDRLSFILNEEG